MGKKRTGAWKYLYLSIACMISISLAGCAAVKGPEAKSEAKNEAEKEARECLVKAQRLLAQGDYEGCLKENQRVLSLYGSVPPGDEALFYTAVIYAHAGYPKKDYRKSLELFRTLVKTFPQSPLARQAEIWVGVLQENERLNREVEELNETLKKSKQVDIEIDKKKKELSK